MTDPIYYGDMLIHDGREEQNYDLVGDVRYYRDLIQGTEEWHQQRLGVLTASTMKLILTPTLKIAANAKEKQHLYELVAQRVNNYVEPSYVSDDMLRGFNAEIEVRRLYGEHHAPVNECGFITTDRLGFTLGFSPDGLVGDDGMIECKSRRAKYQVQTILEDEVPSEYVLQLQTGLFVTGRPWIDFISYCGGLPMFVKRVYPELKFQDAIAEASRAFEMRAQAAKAKFEKLAETMIATERNEDEEMRI